MSANPANPTLRLVAVPAPARSQTFDVDALTAFLDGEHAALKAQVRAVLSHPNFEYRYDIDRTQYRQLIFQRCRELARHGWGAALFPDANGHSDVPKFLAAFETLGISDLNLAIKFGLQFGLFGGAIMYLGTKRHHDKYLPQVATMDLVGCYAMTELGHGSDTRRLETVAQYDRFTSEFVIHTPVPTARKQFIGNAAMHARMAVVFAQLHVDGMRRGVFAFLVPIRNPDGTLCKGVSVEDTGPKAGLLGIDNGCLSFSRVRVPRENLLDRFGTVTPGGQYLSDVDDPTVLMLRSMSGGRIAIAVASLSAAKSGLTIAIRHAAHRRQFGREERLLLDYPIHQRRLLPRLAETYALDAALKHAAALSRESSAATDPQFEELAAVLKAYGTWNAVETLQVCREACGGQGYLAINRVGILRADIDPMTTLEGDNTLLYLLTAKMQLKRLGSTIKDGGRLAVLSQVLGLRREKIAIVLALRTYAGSLRDPEFLLRLFRFRERALLWGTARYLRSADGRGPGADYQTPLAELSQAHAERIVLEQFSRQVERSPGSVRAVLASLRDLYATSCLAGHAGWYLQEKVMTGSDTRRIERRIAHLCNQIRPDAVSLVDSFAIPDKCLAAPIALAEIFDQMEV